MSRKKSKSRSRSRSKSKGKKKKSSMKKGSRKGRKVAFIGPKPRAPRAGRRAFVAPSAGGMDVAVLGAKFNGKASTRIQHEEVLTTMTATSSWSLSLPQIYNIQAGDGVTFPWLSFIAQNFQQYKFNSVTFVYKTRCGSTTPGNVYFAYQQDSLDAPYQTMQAMMQSQGAKDYNVWKTLCVFRVPLRKSNYLQRYFVRFDRTSEEAGDQFYDCGLVSITADGSTSQVGILSVAYDVTLFNPQPPTPTGAPVGLGAWGFVYNVNNSITIGQIKTNPLLLRGSPAFDADFSQGWFLMQGVLNSYDGVRVTGAAIPAGSVLMVASFLTIATSALTANSGVAFQIGTLNNMTVFNEPVSGQTLGYTTVDDDSAVSGAVTLQLAQINVFQITTNVPSNLTLYAGNVGVSTFTGVVSGASCANVIFLGPGPMAVAMAEKATKYRGFLMNRKTRKQANLPPYESKGDRLFEEFDRFMKMKQAQSKGDRSLDYSLNPLIVERQDPRWRGMQQDSEDWEQLARLDVKTSSGEAVKIDVRNERSVPRTEPLQPPDLDEQLRIEAALVAEHKQKLSELKKELNERGRTKSPAREAQPSVTAAPSVVPEVAVSGQKRSPSQEPRSERQSVPLLSSLISMVGKPSS